MMAISYDEAICIAKTFAQELAEQFRNKIVAVFVIGSLGSDYYRPGQSDIDTVVITNCNRRGAARLEKKIEPIQNRYWKEYNVPKGFGAIVFAQEQLYPPYVKKEELVLEILRLKTQSKCIYGNYDVAKIPMPGKQAIIDDAIAFQAWADAEKKKNPDFPGWNAQTLVNATLIVLKRYLMIQHGIIEFNKYKVVGLYLENEPPMVDREVFGFIESALNGGDIALSDEKLAGMAAWQEKLCAAINNLVLYNETSS